MAGTWMTVAEAARALGLSPKYVATMEEGLWREKIRVGHRGRGGARWIWRFRARDVRRLARRRRERARLRASYDRRARALFTECFGRAPAW